MIKGEVVIELFFSHSIRKWSSCLLALRRMKIFKRQGKIPLIVLKYKIFNFFNTLYQLVIGHLLAI